MTLYQIVRCGRCGTDYRAASIDEARAQTCKRCGEAIGFATAVILAVLLVAVVVSMIAVAGTLAG